jgi:hypothetical protein
MFLSLAKGEIWILMFQRGPKFERSSGQGAELLIEFVQLFLDLLKALLARARIRRNSASMSARLVSTLI